MLDIQIFNDEKNQWLIRQFEAYQFSGHAVEDKFLPRPDVSLIFHFKNPAFISSEKPLKVEPYFVAPIIPQSIVLKFSGEMDTLAVTCKATVFSRLFDIDMSPVSKRSITLPKDVFQPLWEKMANLSSTQERTACFSDFIRSLQPMPYRPDAVDLFYAKIIEKSISTPLKEIIRECHASKSTLLRKFIKRTGVSPKTLARIVRLNYLWTRMEDDKAVDYQELVFDGNFFDQAHFINDFKFIIGERPSHFFNRNLNTVKIFSGKLPPEP